MNGEKSKSVSPLNASKSPNYYLDPATKPNTPLSSDDATVALKPGEPQQLHHMKPHTAGHVPRELVKVPPGCDSFSQVFPECSFSEEQFG